MFSSAVNAIVFFDFCPLQEYPGLRATAATVQTVAGIPNFTIVELAHGEVEWRTQLIHPAEEFINGYIAVSDRPGIGHTLNHALISTHS